ncbi:probable beta-1,3-galactosyltransferase 2 [Prunus avium]|uniref:Probable beta-1,3-galactosyltransferase 2 n=1 Tax=Prunus avium TaxID=42229 RepID=A0A6P5T317_PRUAV|nr:probable beta-1,3-galactosyltransferase 2 [Prunus avium]XP_021821568.1 probable beta-1,3-galactosyltransferase 2 [Prunus avium]XP_021821569.1 probable beta-1,3-galactosyltransferase 2 [Prunus avium]
MADWRGMMSKSSGFGGGSMRNNEDFEEEDVWGVGNNERENSSPKMMRKCNKDSSSASSSAWRLPTAPRIIPRAVAANTPTSHEPKVVQKSAPQNIPDWSKIYGKSAKIGSWVHDDDDGYGVNGGHVAYEDGGHHHDHGVSDDDDDVNNDGDGDDDDGMVPPHEWVARKLARSQISSFSVCEGIGRTLKGRDLSKCWNEMSMKSKRWGGEVTMRNVMSRNWAFLLCFCSFCAGVLFTNRLWMVHESRPSRIGAERIYSEPDGCNQKLVIKHTSNDSPGEATNHVIQELNKTISNLEMKLAASRGTHESVHNGSPISGNLKTVQSNSKKKYFMVIGINTAFNSRKRRDSVRATWMPQGEERKKLEEEKGIVIRFVIGHSSTAGGILDKAIEAEEQVNEDLLRLNHVEGYLELSAKTKTYFSTAVALWDAEFYVKVDDDVHVNLATLGMILSKHHLKPRVYIGCMKSGPVLARKGVKYHEPEYWKFGEVGNKYFRHATGQLYAISKDLATYISINQDVLHKYANEDVSLGSWFIGLDVEQVDDRRLCCGTPPDCVWKAMTGNICAASFDWRCSGICRSVERIMDVHERCGEDKNAIWNARFSQ